MAEQSARTTSGGMNLPNQITVARLIVSVIMFVTIPLGWYWISLILFVLAAGTDWLDGYIARKYNLVTQLGRILDPFADKLLICGVFIFLAAEANSGIAAWMAVIVVARELLITAIRSFLETHGADFSANMAGKLKMVFQCAAVVASFLLLAMSDAPTWLPMVVTALAWLAVLSTVYSGAGYVFKAIGLLKTL
ncbi:MAG: CDP-diacylglycerol--glycerol-3-phosphate 3-phosphatidyltransferase [Planctomycetales bacterium]|nr:CDP-diacylglycerol--glycerol-3-phosphate 3-phosphatidyltransferase [Planctomycetales bacterium]